MSGNTIGFNSTLDMTRKMDHVFCTLYLSALSQSRRKVLKSEGASRNNGGHNLPLLVDNGLTNLPKSGGAMAP